jgi:hypothetical protein
MVEDTNILNEADILYTFARYPPFSDHYPLRLITISLSVGMWSRWVRLMLSAY